MTLNQRDREFIQCSKKIAEQRNLIGFSQQKILSSYRTSFFIYKENLVSLRKVLKKYYEIHDTLYEKDVKRWHIQRNIIRHFHNVISSANSFIDHLKRTKRKAGFLSEFEQKFETLFKNNELHDFMHVLRNYVLHIHCLPLISRKDMRRNNGKKEVRIYESLDKHRIIEFINSLNTKKDSNAFPKAKSYMEKTTDKISLNNVVNDYDKILTDFYSWFIRNYIIHNKNNFLELVAVNEKFREFAKSKNLNTENPLNETQVRYLKYLVDKFNK